MPELFSNYGISIKAETTPGTYSTPAMGVDAVAILAAHEPEWDALLKSPRDGLPAGGGYNVAPDANPIGKFLRAAFEAELRGSGVAATDPMIGRVLKTFMTQTITTTVDYTLGSTQSGAGSTVSLLAQRGSKQWSGNAMVPERLILRGPDNEGRSRWLCTLAGRSQADPTQQALEAQVFGAQAAQPAKFVGTFTIGGVTFAYRSFELDFGITADAVSVDRGTADGLGVGLVTSCKPVLRFPGEVVTIATHNPFTRLTAPSSPLVLSLTIGDAVGSRYIISGDHVEYLRAGMTAQSEREWWDLELSFRTPASGDLLRIKHN